MRLIEHIERGISEVITSISNASKGDFSKPINKEGLSGAFLEAVSNVEQTINFMKEQNIRLKIDLLNAKLSAMGVQVTESLTIIQSDLKHNIESLKSVTASTNDASRLANDSRDNITTVVEELHQLNEHVNINNGNIEELANQTASITTVIDLITDIADQTNLLALNAAIEAARAGEIQESSEVIKETVDKSTEKIEQFESTLVELSSSALDNVHQSINMENSIFTVLAKIDHILYKSRAYNSLISQKQMLKPVNHHQCNLGKWYEGEGRERFGTTQAYTALEQPHNIVHTNANKNLAYLEAEDPELNILDAEDEIIKNFEAMEEASNRLFGILEAMLEEAKQ
ncbi:MAG: CZB domain-containing protein [Epsilonproteobacteria bacterium]|nr:CZB domain-containing protein [Campylobacterota bacterium]